MSHGWANRGLWMYLPSEKNDDIVRDYFGETVAWMFVWQSFYARCLFVPAILGSIFYFRRYFLSPVAQNILQLSFALLMSFWVMWFNVSYKRYEKRVQTRWGNCNVDQDSTVREEYRPELHRTWRITFVKVLGHILGCGVVGLVMLGTWGLHELRKYF